MAVKGIGINHGDEYYTPLEVVSRFGQFDYDPATTPEKAAEFGITNFDTKETDGLLSDWSSYKRIWINPPFTLKDKFLSKAMQTYQKTKADIYVIIPISFLTTKRFKETGAVGTLYIPDYRINFENKFSKSSPSMGSIILKLSDRWGIRFIERNTNGTK